MDLQSFFGGAAFGAVIGWLVSVFTNGFVVPKLKRIATGEAKKEKEAKHKEEIKKEILKIIQEDNTGTVPTTGSIRDALKERIGKDYEINEVLDLLHELRREGRVKKLKDTFESAKDPSKQLWMDI